MRSEEIKSEMESIKRQLEPLQQQFAKLERRYRDALSLEFIAARGITRDQVEPCSGESKPYFGHIREFIKWLGCHPGKPWAEWNGMLYETSELMTGRMTDTPACYEHLS